MAATAGRISSTVPNVQLVERAAHLIARRLSFARPTNSVRTASGDPTGLQRRDAPIPELVPVDARLEEEEVELKDEQRLLDVRVGKTPAPPADGQADVRRLREGAVEVSERHGTREAGMRSQKAGLTDEYSVQSESTGAEQLVQIGMSTSVLCLARPADH